MTDNDLTNDPTDTEPIPPQEPPTPPEEPTEDAPE